MVSSSVITFVSSHFVSQFLSAIMLRKQKRRCPARPTSMVTAASSRLSHSIRVTHSTPRSTHADSPLLPSPSTISHTALTATLAPTGPTPSTIADTTQPPLPGPLPWRLYWFPSGLWLIFLLRWTQPPFTVPTPTRIYPSTSVMASTPSSVTPQLSGTYMYPCTYLYLICPTHQAL